jgi:hypothetical protein
LSSLTTFKYRKTLMLCKNFHFTCWKIWKQNWLFWQSFGLLFMKSHFFSSLALRVYMYVYTLENVSDGVKCNVTWVTSENNRYSHFGYVLPVKNFHSVFAYVFIIWKSIHSFLPYFESQSSKLFYISLIIKNIIIIIISEHEDNSS